MNTHQHHADHNQRRQRPPYAALAFERMRRYRQPRGGEIRIYTGREAWAYGHFLEQGRNLNSSLIFSILPPGKDPASYDWRLVENWPVAVFETGDTPAGVLYQLGYALLKAGASIVRVIDSNTGHVARFSRGCSQ